MLTPKTMQVCGKTIDHLSQACLQLEGNIFIPLEEQQMLEAAKAVLDRAFDEVMIMFTHLNNAVLKEREAKSKLTPVGAQGPQVTKRKPFDENEPTIIDVNKNWQQEGTNNQALSAAPPEETQTQYQVPF